MTLRLFIPGDAGAVALDSDAVAAAVQAAADHRNAAVEIVRNGSRGLYWLEPMVEVETATGRVAYGPVTPADAASVLDAALAGRGANEARLLAGLHAPRGAHRPLEDLRPRQFLRAEHVHARSSWTTPNTSSSR